MDLFGHVNTSTVNGPSSADLIKAVLDMKAKLESLPKSEFDCLVCLPGEYAAILKCVKEVEPKRPPGAFGAWSPDSPFGIDLHVCQTVFEARDVGEELRRAGKRPVVITPGDPDCILARLLNALCER